MTDHRPIGHHDRLKERASSLLRTLLPSGWRAARDGERLVEEARERDGWSDEQWRRWRAERLGAVLERAATRVPYYRRQWAERRRRGDRASWTYLENWPVLEREALEAAPQAFVADDLHPARLLHVRTGGTTAMPLELWRGHDAARAFDALAVLRARRWYGIEPGDRGAAVVAGEEAVGEVRRLTLVTTDEAPRNLVLTVARPDPAALARVLDLLGARGVTYLVGRPSVLAALAHEALRRRRPGLGVRTVITAGEALTGEQRCLMGEAFLCSVRETYAMAEQVAAASECWAGRLHEWPDVGVSEILDGSRPADVGTLGDVVCTGLVNADMPLIRYRVGDCAKPAAPAHACRCGCLLPPFVRVEGRRSDVLVAPDGRRVAWASPVFDGLPIREGEVTQESAGRVRVRYVPLPWSGADLEELLRTRLHARMGRAVEVVLECVGDLPYAAGAMGARVVRPDTGAPAPLPTSRLP